jgi:hypothetical protein
MANQRTDVQGAISAAPDPNHSGGVIYTFDDGSTLDIYGGYGFSYRTLNPGIKAYSGPGVIGTVPKTINGTTYQYPVFDNVQDAETAVLSVLDGYNSGSVNGGGPQLT